MDIIPSMEFTAPSGAEVIINAASFEAASELYRALQRAVGLNGINFSEDLSSLLSKLLLVDSAPEVNSCLWPCLIKSLRNKEKITKSTFDKVEARQDYYEIVVACARVNLAPLVQGLISELSKSGLMTTRKPPASPE